MVRIAISIAILFFSTTVPVSAQDFRSIDNITDSEPILIDDRPVVFENINVVSMVDDRIQPGMDVLVSGDRIRSIRPHGEVVHPSGAAVIDGSGHYLMPGLAEMHGHIPPIESDRLPDRYLDDVLFLYLSGGVTTVRGMLGHENQLLLKESVNSSELLGPNLYLAGPSFSGGSISSPEQAARRAQQQIEEGWDLLKVHPGVTLAEYQAMAEVANDAGMPFAGHIPEEVGLETAIRMGQQTIEHMAGYIRFMDAETEPVSDEQLSRAVALTVENDVGVVPTQALWKTLIGAADTEQLLSYSELNYMPPAVVQNWKNFLDEGVKNTPFYSGEFASVHAENRQKLLKALQEGGARILFGTDAPQIFSVPGFSVRHELTIMEEAGLTPYEILTTATRAVGRHFEEKDRFGTVTEGSRADLLMVSENPLETPDTITQHRGVMIRGLWLPRQQIDEKLSEIEEYYH